MTKLALCCILAFTVPAWAALNPALEQAAALGAPMAAVERALQISQGSNFKKDVFAVFDLSQPAANKRFYVIDLKNGRAAAHYAAHGKSNGDNYRAFKFRGFQRDLDMTPLGPVRVAAAHSDPHYATIVDRYTGQAYSGQIVANMEGVTAYNRYLSTSPGWAWIVHPNWYTTASYRRQNPGKLGLSWGCITLDPVVNNQVIGQLQGGGLIYITVGNDPIEKYL